MREKAAHNGVPKLWIGHPSKDAKDVGRRENLALNQKLVQNYAMSTRANIHLDDDAYAFAYAYARGKGIPLGAAVSELLLRAEKMPQEPAVLAPPKFEQTERGYWVIAATPGRVLTPEMVKEFSEDEIE